MAVDSANARELEEIAHEIGADVQQGILCYPSATGGWQLGDLDLSEHLARYRGQRLVLIIAPLGAAEPKTYTCGICGFVMNEVGECPRCKLIVQQQADELADTGERRSVLDQVEDLLAGLNI